MLPYLARIGPILIPTHAVTWFLAYTIGTVGVLNWLRRENLDSEKILNGMLLLMVVSLIGSRASAILFLSSDQQLIWFLRHPIEIFKIWKGGMSLYGIVGGVVVVGTWYGLRHNLPIRRIADLGMPWVFLGHFIQSWGCLATGCHPGSPTSLPWGIVYYYPLFKGPKGIPLHPFPIYLALITLFGFFLAWGWVRVRDARGEKFFLSFIYYPLARILRVRFMDGELLLYSGIYYSVARFIVEFTRHSSFQIWYPNWSLPQAQMACFFIFFLTIFGYLVLWTYEDCKKKGIPYPGWMRFLLRILDGMIWVSKRVPWPIRQGRGC